MKREQRTKARQMAEMRDKIRKDIRNGVISKNKAKTKMKKRA